MLIRLGHQISTFSSSLHNGPGWRISLWTQGCIHRCTSTCLNPLLLDPKGGFKFPVGVVLREVLKKVTQHPEIEGITVLGGEPFEQADAVADLCASVRAHNLSTMVYSGHTFEHLQVSNLQGISRLLKETDILVDGPFLPKLRDETIAWRGSTNQRIMCLSERYTSTDLEKAFANQGKGYSIVVGKGRISASGLQSREAATQAEADIVDLPESSVAKDSK